MKNIFRNRIFITAVCFFSLIFFRCTQSGSQYSTDSRLDLIKKINLPFTEPSGIAYSSVLNKMWVVGGGSQRIYMLDENGIVEKKLIFKGTDLEGITFDERDSTLWVVDESKKIISHLDLDGSLLSQIKLTYKTKHNKGPEGITIGKGHKLFVINEGDPSVLMQVNLNSVIENTYQLNFASDYSDVSYNPSDNTYFIISDESKAFFIWSISEGVKDRFALPNKKNEGLAFNPVEKLFYIVNDKTSELYFYKLK